MEGAETGKNVSLTDFFSKIFCAYVVCLDSSSAPAQRVSGNGAKLNKRRTICRRKRRRRRRRVEETGASGDTPRSTIGVSGSAVRTVN